VGQAMAYVSSAMSVGLILGPLLGGVIYQRHGYYAAFGLAFAFIGLDLVLRLIIVEKKIAVRYTATPLVPDQENPQIVKLQPLPATTGMSTSNSALALSEEVPVPPLNVQRSRIPHVIRILKYPRLLVALFISFVQALILSAFDATLPLYLNALFDYSALQAGNTFVFACVNVRSDLYGPCITCFFHITTCRLAMRQIRTQTPCCRRSSVLSPLSYSPPPSTC
jgi:MFS family permease